MTALKQLTPHEVLFVGGESSTIYQHAAGLLMLDPSGVADFGFDKVRAQLVDRLSLVPHFRWRLHEVPLGLDLPYWAEDDEFSFDHHIRRVAVPSPGDRDALAELVGYLYSRHLDRRRPLWELWFIEGMADGSAALFAKLHHCLMDGEGANQLVMAISDLAPDADEAVLIDPALTRATPGPRPVLWQESVIAAHHLATMPLRATREILAAGRDELRRRMRGNGAERPPVPHVGFNAMVGTERGFVFGSLSLTDVKRVKDHFGVTVNDVVLALVGGSVRHYLLARDELPDESLRTAIAVSLRGGGDDAMANKVTTSGVTLATDLDDPVERLATIARDAERAKREAREGSSHGTLEMLAAFPPALVGAMLSLATADQVVQAAGVNLIVSNLRGSPLPLYIGGARATGIYPMSIIMHGGGINLTCMSYVDEVDIGVAIEPDIVPDPWRLVERLDDELAALLARVPAG